MQCDKLLSKALYLLVCAICMLGLALSQTAGQCETVTISLCKDLGYNEAIFPNSLRQDQQQAANAIGAFAPLIRSQCSPALKRFLCLLYAPPCTTNKRILLPCRPQCTRSKAGCERLMNQNGSVWPLELNCTKFPVSGQCIGDTLPPTAAPIRTSTTSVPIAEQLGAYAMEVIFIFM
jgi:hypothetical protein